MKIIQKLLVFTAILSAACTDYSGGPETLDEGAPSGMDDSVASVEQGLSTITVSNGICPSGFLCVFTAAKKDNWGVGAGIVGCGWYFYPPGIANLISAIINNQQPGAVSYFYDARGASPNDDVYIGQSQAFDEIDDLQQRRAADGSDPNDRIDYVHVTQPGCSG
jgi:hypothetical protein